MASSPSVAFSSYKDHTCSPRAPNSSQFWITCDHHSPPINSVALPRKVFWKQGYWYRQKLSFLRLVRRGFNRFLVDLLEPDATFVWEVHWSGGRISAPGNGQYSLRRKMDPSSRLMGSCPWLRARAEHQETRYLQPWCSQNPTTPWARERQPSETPCPPWLLCPFQRS